MPAVNDAPRRTLREIARRYGRDVLRDPRRCRALLLDLCPEYKGEINLLEMALRADLAREVIASAAHYPRALLVARLVQRLRDAYYLPEEAARWAVIACVEAIDGGTAGAPEGGARVLRSGVAARVLVRRWLAPDDAWDEIGATPGEIAVPAELEVRVVSRVDDAELVRLAQDIAAFGEIQRLDLSYAAISGATLNALDAMTGLLHLDLSRTQADDEALAFVAHQAQLMELDVWGCDRITDAGLVHLEALQRLERLELGQCPGVTDAGLPALVALPRLSTLGVAGTRVGDGGLAAIRQMRTLKRLDLAHTSVIGPGLGSVAMLADLWSLSLFGCVHLRSDALAGLRPLRALSALNLGRCGLLSDQAMVYLRPLRALSELRLEGVAITDGGVLYLTDLHGLALLDLSWTRVADAGVARLGALRGLRTLMLAGTGLTDTGLASLTTLRGLADLDVSNTHVTDAGLRTLSALTTLESLDLEGTEVHDAGLVHLGELPQLRKLYLGRTPITDKGLELLQRVTHLAMIDLTMCGRVTSEGVKRLEEAGVTVSW